MNVATKCVMVKMSDKLHGEFKRRCLKRGETISEAIRRAVVEYLEKKK